MMYQIPNCCYPIYSICSVSELFRSLTSTPTPHIDGQQRADSPKELIPHPSEFRTSETTEYPEWTDTTTYTLHTDNEDVFYYVMCGK